MELREAYFFGGGTIAGVVSVIVYVWALDTYRRITLRRYIGRVERATRPRS